MINNLASEFFSWHPEYRPCIYCGGKKVTPLGRVRYCLACDAAFTLADILIVNENKTFTEAIEYLVGIQREPGRA